MNKFIISNNGELVFGNVGYHWELCDNTRTCHGGGFYLINDKTKEFIMWGDSFEYGGPCFDYWTTIPKGYEDYKFTYKNLIVEPSKLVL